MQSIDKEESLVRSAVMAGADSDTIDRIRKRVGGEMHSMLRSLNAQYYDCYVRGETATRMQGRVIGGR